MLIETGLVEILDSWSTEEGPLTRLATLCRLRPGFKEADWVQRIVKPMHEWSWQAAQTKVFMAKLYIAKDATGGSGRKVVFAFRTDVLLTDPAKQLPQLKTVLSGAPIKPEQAEFAGVRFLDELPQEVIERPLAWTENTPDRNVSRPKESQYFHITGQRYIPTAGASFISSPNKKGQ